jgi:hypothetical protein
MNEFKLMKTDRNSTKVYAKVINKVDDCCHFILQIKYTDKNGKQLGNIIDHTADDIEDQYNYIRILMKPLEDARDSAVK